MILILYFVIGQEATRNYGHMLVTRAREECKPTMGWLRGKRKGGVEENLVHWQLAHLGSHFTFPGNEPETLPSKVSA